MEKRKPHYDLELVKRLAADPARRKLTKVAKQGLNELAWNANDVWNCVLALERSQFQKSMTSYLDHRLWEDLYTPTFRGVALYVKLQIQDDVVVVVVSFKRK